MVRSWSKEAVGVAPESDLGVIRRALWEYTQEFVKDYRRANQPTPPKGKPEEKN